MELFCVLTVWWVYMRSLVCVKAHILYIKNKTNYGMLIFKIKKKRLIGAGSIHIKQKKLRVEKRALGEMQAGTLCVLDQTRSSLSS